jgi:antitoxin VapB
MALSIKHPTADQLARELSALTGETITDAIINALEERLARYRLQRSVQHLSDEIMMISEHCSSLPVLDSRNPDEILGYGEKGIPDGD